MPVDPRLLDILCCPAEDAGVSCHGVLREHPDGLLCQTCGRVYPIEDDIPVMLPNRAREVEQ